MSNKIRIAICDDSVHLCEGYKMFINSQEDMECVGIAHGSEQCVKMLSECNADLLLLDIQMETEKAGIQVLPTIKNKYPDIKIIMLTGYENNQYVFKSIINGADGYVIKETNGLKMLDEIRIIYMPLIDGTKQFDIMDAFKSGASEVYDSLKSMHYVMNDLVKLSTSEYEILREIYSGKTYKKIAQMRVVEECTIKTTASRILKKLDMVSMKELIRILKELRVFESMD